MNFGGIAMGLDFDVIAMGLKWEGTLVGLQKELWGRKCKCN